MQEKLRYLQVLQKSKIAQHCEEQSVISDRIALETVASAGMQNAQIQN